MTKRWMLIFLIILAMSAEVAAAERLRPYVLAWEGESALQTVLENTRQSLSEVGFEVIGEYRPFDDAYVLVVTAPLLIRMAQLENHAAFLAAQRISVAKVAGRVQVSYQNPAYYQLAYRIKASLQPLAEAFDASLGRVAEFGSDKGLPVSRLARYHYGYGMEYFDDQLLLADHGSQKAALKAIEASFAEHADLVKQIYQLRIDRDTSVIGVGVHSGAGADQAVHAVLDYRDRRHVAQLPYEMVVHKGEVWALHPRFRLALNFPDVKMVGEHSFMQLREAPDELHVALKLAAGGMSAKTPGKTLVH